MNMSNMFGGAERKNSQHLRFEEFVPSSGWTEDSDSYCLIIDLPGFERDQVKLQVDDYGYLEASGEMQVNEYKHVRFQQSYKVPDNSNIEETTAKFEDEILYIVIPKKVIAGEESQHEITNIPEAVAEEKETKHNEVEKVPEPLIQEGKEKDKDQNSDVAANDGHGMHHHSDKDTSEEEKDHDDDDDDDEEEEEEEEEEDEREEFHDTRTEKLRNEVSLMGELGKQLQKNKGIWITAVLAFSLGVLVSKKFQADEE